MEIFPENHPFNLLGFLYFDNNKPSFYLSSPEINFEEYDRNPTPFYYRPIDEKYLNLSRFLIISGGGDTPLSRELQNSFEKYYDFISILQENNFIDSVIKKFASLQKQGTVEEKKNFKDKFNRVLQFFHNFQKLSYYLFTKETYFTFLPNLLAIFYTMTDASFESCGTISISPKTDKPPLSKIPSFRVKTREEKIPEEYPEKIYYNVIFHVDKIGNCNQSGRSYGRAIHFHTHPLRYTIVNELTLERFISVIFSVISPPSTTDLGNSFSRLFKNSNDIDMIFTHGGIYIFRRNTLPGPTFEMYESEEYIKEVTKDIDEVRKRVNITQNERKKNIYKTINNLLYTHLKIDPKPDSKIHKYKLNDLSKELIKNLEESVKSFNPELQLDQMNHQQIKSYIMNLLFREKSAYDTTKKIIDEFLSEINVKIYEEKVKLEFTPVYWLEIQTRLAGTLGGYSYPQFEVKVFPRMAKHFGLDSLSDL